LLAHNHHTQPDLITKTLLIGQDFTENMLLLLDDILSLYKVFPFPNSFYRHFLSVLSITFYVFVHAEEYFTTYFSNFLNKLFDVWF